MKLIDIETTPNPNSMKLNLDYRFSETKTYTAADKSGCPDFVEQLLTIDGVVSVFVCANFLTLNRDPLMEWQPILDRASHILASRTADSQEAQQEPAKDIGQSQVSILMFKGIPMQIKASDSGEQKRAGLSQRFTEAVELLKAKTGADFIKERYWAEEGTRYGSPDEVLVEVAEEVEGLYPPERIAKLVAEALGEKPDVAFSTLLPQDPASSDWQERLRALQEMNASEESIDIFARALEDTKPQIRRWAAARLGAIGSPKAVPSLVKALTDPNVGVRRTAGDSLSDIGDISAQPAMCRALSDENKLVRWRAARYLSEGGTAEAIPFLQAALEDPEYEVRLEVQSALKRIQDKDATRGQAGPVWKQISQ